MNRILKIIIVSILLVSIATPLTYVYAIDNKENESFFEISKTEASKDDIIEMSIDLKMIEYDNFTIGIKSDASLEQIAIKEEIEVEKSSNVISMRINKEECNLSKVTLLYEIPKNVNIGDKIVFTAIVTNSDDEEKSETVKKEIKIIDKTNIGSGDKYDENSTNNDSSNKENENNTDNKSSNKENENNTDNKSEANNKDESSGNEQTTTNNKPSNVNTNTSNIADAAKNTQSGNSSNTSNNTQNTQIVGTISKTASSSSNISTSVSVEPTVTYNGSDNNYLSELSIQGYAFSKNFSKENFTYFVTVSNDIQKLDIVANTENSNATVCVYGNENLQNKNNKILISVTAENGNVRYYRIYVTKN